MPPDPVLGCTNGKHCGNHLLKHHARVLGISEKKRLIHLEDKFEDKLANPEKQVGGMNKKTTDSPRGIDETVTQTADPP